MGKPDLNREIGAALEPLIDGRASCGRSSARASRWSRPPRRSQLIDERRATGKVVLDVR